MSNQMLFCLSLLTVLVFSVEDSYENMYGHLLKEVETRENHFQSILLLLTRIQREQTFENLIVFRSSHIPSNECIFESTSTHMGLANVLLNENFATEYRYNEHYSKATMIVVCAYDFESVLNVLDSKYLWDLNTQRHIVQLDDLKSKKVTQFCKQVFKRDVYNVLIILQDFHSTLMFYKCYKFPENDESFYIGFLNQSSEIFENQFLNFYGAHITALPDQQVPRSMVYIDKNGKFQLLGYMGKLIQTFAEQRNATLYFPLQIKLGKILLYEDLRKLINNGILDIAITSITSPSYILHKGFSYPYDVTSCCFMIPLPDQIPFYKVYFLLVETHILVTIFALIIVYGVLLLYTFNGNLRKVSLGDIIVNDRSLRGILGQSYPMPVHLNLKAKFICFQLCYASLLINTTYQAYLHSFFTRPPIEKQITTPDDVQAAGLKILLPEVDLAYLKHINFTMVRTHPNIFNGLKNYTEFKRIRRSLDTRYMYSVYRVRWLAYNEQQAHFRQKLFFYNDGDFCLVKLLLLGVPIRESLPYRDLLNDFILRVHDSGLYKFWVSQNFFDLVRLKISSFKDLSKPEYAAKEIRMEDYYWISIAYAICIVLSMLVFVGELIVDPLTLLIRRRRYTTSNNSTD